MNLSKLFSCLIRKKFLMLFGFMLSVVFLEFILRTGGFVILSLRERDNRKILQDKKSYRIMCLGGSTTADGGKHSYPAQLERILNNRNIGTKFSVLNKGVEGMNSDYIVSRIEHNLSKYNPDMVIIMTGINDGHSVVKYEDKLFINIGKYIEKVRVYKLANILFLSIKNKFLNNSRNNNAMIQKEDSEYLDPVISYRIDRLNSDSEKAYQYLKAIAGVEQDNIDIQITFGDSLILQGRYQEAEQVLEKVLEMSPDNTEALAILGWCCVVNNKLQKAEEVLSRAIRVDPVNSRAHWELFKCYMEQNKIEEIKDLCLKILKDDINNDVVITLAGSFLEKIGEKDLAERYFKTDRSLRMKYYNPITKRNYKKLTETILSKGIILVCVQYPCRDIDPLKKIFDSIDGIVFVDNEDIFKDAVFKDGYDYYFMDNFGGDFGHCTPEGNRLLAQNVANTILKDVFKIKRDGDFQSKE